MEGEERTEGRTPCQAAVHHLPESDSGSESVCFCWRGCFALGSLSSISIWMSEPVDDTKLQMRHSLNFHRGVICESHWSRWFKRTNSIIMKTTIIIIIIIRKNTDFQLFFICIYIILPSWESLTPVLLWAVHQLLFGNDHNQGENPSGGNKPSVEHLSQRPKTLASRRERERNSPFRDVGIQTQRSTNKSWAGLRVTLWFLATACLNRTLF